MKRWVCILFCLVLCLTVISFSVNALSTIDKVDLEDLDMPLAGAKPDTSVTIRTPGYKIYSLDWYDVTADRYLDVGDKFIDGNVYRVVIWMEAKDGFEFKYTNSYTPEVKAKVNGKNAQVNKAYEYNAWAMVEICYDFPAACSKWVSSLNIQLEGITKKGNVLYAQEDGYIPYTIKSATEDISVYPQLNTNRYYPDGFRWSDLGSGAVKSNGDRFKGGCEYYVHIAILLKNGGFTDDLEVTINGKTATIKTRGQDFAEAGVEVTCFGGIKGTDIRPVVILPKEGNYPDYGTTYAYPQCKNIDYASVEGWYDVETGKRITSQDAFVGGKQYRVEICCTAAYPYVFARDANDKMQYSPQITGHDVDSYTFGYDDYRGRELIYIKKTFTAETRDHVCVAGDWQCDESGHKNYCTICKKALAGGAHWSMDEATCGHGKLCGVCGYEFTEPTEEHTPDTKWAACGALYHAHLCKVCGAHCDQQDHTPGPEATETTAQTCTVCGFILAPAKNHVHDLSRVPQTPAECLKGGNIEYYFCTGCNDCFTDSAGKNKIPETMSVEVAPLGHDLQAGKCSRCGYESAEEALVTEPEETIAATVDQTVPAATEENAPPQSQKPASMDPMFLIGGAAILFALALVITVILRKKKN